MTRGTVPDPPAGWPTTWVARRVDTVDRLLDVAGRTFADEAGIVLRDQPAPLYRLLVLTVLLSSRVQSHRALGLPDDPETLAARVTGDDVARLAAALVRAARDSDVVAEVVG